MIRLPIGFDALAAPDAVDWKRPTFNEREMFFIRPEISSPVSVNRPICPSIFQPEIQTIGKTELLLTQFSPSFPAVRTTLHSSPDWPESDVNILGLWSNLDRMLSWLRERPTFRKFVWFPVAIAVFLDDASVLAPLWQEVSDNGIIPSAPPPQWSSLGYDVADEAQNSALSNCKFEEREMVEARLRWRSHLNQHGLLDDLAAAAQFVLFSNKRVPEHAPFFVYEIHRINAE